MQTVKKRRDFLAASNSSLYCATPSFILQKRIDSSQGGIRFGFTASRKVGGAVERNRCKRRLRSLVRKISDYPQESCDYILIARRQTLTHPFQAMESDFKRAIARLEAQSQNLSS